MIQDFRWSYASTDEQGIVQINDYPAVRFDQSWSRTGRWMAARHANGMLHEPAFTYVLWRLIAESQPPIYFDIGSFLGYFTILPLPWLPPHSRVYAFEMNPTSIFLLQANVNFNRAFGISRVFIVNCGVGDRVQYAKEMFVDGFVLRDVQPADPAAKCVALDLLTLDHIHECFGICPDLIKMDIEGFEALAFAGARKLLAENAPTIVFELHSEQRLAEMNSTREKIISELEELGYEIAAVRGNRHNQLKSDRPLGRVTPKTRERFLRGDNSSFVATKRKNIKTVVDRMLDE